MPLNDLWPEPMFAATRGEAQRRYSGSIRAIAMRDPGRRQRPTKIRLGSLLEARARPPCLNAVIAYSQSASSHKGVVVCLRDLHQNQQQPFSIKPIDQTRRLCGSWGISSSISRDTSRIASGCWPFWRSAYLSACSRLANKPPKMSFCSRTTQFPKRFLPTKILDPVQLLEGYSTSVITIDHEFAASSSGNRSGRHERIGRCMFCWWRARRFRMRQIAGEAYQCARL